MRALIAGMLLWIAAGPALSDQRLLVQSTTSTQNSGLYDHLLPRFTAATGIRVRVVAVGTGQALKNAANCDGDVLIVHSPDDETAFVAAGYGVRRHPLMHNDFVLVGPAADPAAVAGLSVTRALARLSGGRHPFVSRGDDSGTHRKERALWRDAGIDPTPASGDWYRETGSGMGAALNIAVAMGAYVLTDRATWAAFGNRRDFAILVAGDAALANPYGIIQVSPDHCPRTRADAAARFVDWMLAPEGQAAIADYRIDGQQLFFPGAP